MTSDPRRCPHCQTDLPADAPQGSCPRCLLSAGFESADGAPIADVPERAEVERLFPDMEILEVLGRGGMGIVFKARQKALDRIVALKVLPKSVAGDAGDVGRFEERFTREARALARLSHRNIVGVHEFGQRDGLYFFAMEFVDGANLRQAMEAGRLTPTEALAIVPQICDALQFAHDQGVVHRDIKPENVLIDISGAVKIADFGLAKLMVRSAGDRTLTRQGLVMGTPHYMAPEQVETPGEVDHRADIYSLGVVIYEMLTGELPIGRFAKPSEKVQVDVRIDDVVLRTLEKERGRRYQRVSDVRTSIDEVTDPGSGAPATRADRSEHVASHAGAAGPRRTSKLAVWGLLTTPITAALVGVVLGVAWMLLDVDGTDGGAVVGVWIATAMASIVGLGLLTAVALSAAALIGIQRSEGKQQGTALAVIGLLLPLLCCVPVGAGSLALRGYQDVGTSSGPYVYEVEPNADESAPPPQPLAPSEAPEPPEASPPETAPDER